MKRRIAFIALLLISVFLTGCAGLSSKFLDTTGSAVANERESIEEAASDVYNCENKKKLLEDELRALESDLVVLEEKKAELVKDIRTSRGEEKDTVVNEIRSLNDDLKTVQGQIDTMNEIVGDISCP